MNFAEQIITKYHKIPANLKYIMFGYFSISIINFGCITFLNSLKISNEHNKYSNVKNFVINIKNSLFWPTQFSYDYSFNREYDSEDDEYY